MAQAINWRGCIQKVKETVKADLPDEEILSVLRKAKASVDRKKRIEGTVNNAEFIKDFANDAIDEATRAAQALKIQRLRQIVLYRERSTHIKLARQAGMNEFEATSSLSVTSHKSFIGAADSVETRQKAKSYEYGKIYDDYERLGLGRFVRESTPEFRRDYAIERSILSGVKREGTGNQQAKDLALLNFKYQEKARRDLNDLGADIGKLDDFIARQTHNRIKLKKYSYIEWRDDVMKWVSDDTFDWIDEGLTNGQRLDLVDEWLGGFHDNVLTGLHDDVNALEWSVIKDLEEFKGHANLAKKLSQSRKLHFKDAESWLAYNEKYGNGNVFETTLQGLESSARAYGLMSVWGTNPQAAFDNHLKQIASDLKKESVAGKGENANKTDKLDKFTAQQQKLRNQFDQVTGKANIARDPTLAAIGSVYRTITTLARLGGVAFSSVTDVPIKASVMRHNGIHVLQGNLDGLVSYVRGLGSEEQQRFISQFMVANEGMIAFYNSKLTEKGSIRGWAARGHYFFGKYSLLNYVTSAQRSGMGMALTHNMAMLANKNFDQLDKLLQGNLIRYNIDNLAWDVLRKTKAEVIQGKSFIGTDGVHNLDLQEFTELARRNHTNFDNVKPERQQKLLIEARDKLELRYRQYIVDQVDESITKVGAREKAFMYGESKPGTVWGEVVRLFWQFKSFGLTYVSKHLRREFGRYGKANIPGIVQLMVGTTLFGIAANALSDVSAGRVPRSLDDPRTWLAAFIRGGGAGIYGDFIFGEFSRYGSSPLAAIAGPGIGNIESVLRIAGNLRDGEAGKAGTEMFRLFKSHVPFQNLFYTKQVTDYLFFNQLLEVINPGYLKKMEKRLETTYGQSYFLPPSSLVKDGGGFK